VACTSLCFTSSYSATSSLFDTEALGINYEHHSILPFFVCRCSTWTHCVELRVARSSGISLVRWRHRRRWWHGSWKGFGITFAPRIRNKRNFLLIGRERRRVEGLAVFSSFLCANVGNRRQPKRHIAFSRAWERVHSADPANLNKSSNAVLRSIIMDYEACI